MAHTRSQRFLRMVGFDVSISSTGLLGHPDDYPPLHSYTVKVETCRTSRFARRSMYVADPGCVLLYFDLSQAEARVVAYRANIPKWKEQFEQARLDGKYDCHRALASEMFKMPYDQVPTEGLGR